MTFPLGRFGDNRVTPDVLFDVDDPTARPPEDAIDVQFRCPVSLSVMLDAMAQAGRSDLLGDWRQLYAELAAETARFVQRTGRGVDVERSGRAPARLAITPVMHGEVPGFATARWHLHVYVGATATNLLDERPVPVDPKQVQAGISRVAYPRHINRLEELVAYEWDVRWDEPRAGAVNEIVEPPWHEHIDTSDRGVCPGPEPWGPRRLVLADEQDLMLAERDERDIARARAEGRGWERPKLLFEGEVLPTTR